MYYIPSRKDGPPLIEKGETTNFRGRNITENTKEEEKQVVSILLFPSLFCLFSHVFYGVYITHTKHPPLLYVFYL
jgi:hypothetical protein